MQIIPVRIAVTLALYLVADSLFAAEDFSAAFIADELKRARSDPDSSVTVQISAPAHYVFEFLTLRLDEYTDAIDVKFDHAQSQLPGMLNVGSKRISELEDNELLVQRFLHFDAPREYAYFTDMALSTIDLPLRYSISHYQLHALGQGNTQLDVKVVYQPTSRLLGFIVRRAFNSGLRRDFNAAAKIIETSYAAEAGTAARE